MDPLLPVFNGLWSGLFAMAMGIMLTVRPRRLVSTFLCGFAGRIVRDLLMAEGTSQNWATVVAAVVVVLVAVAFIRGRVVPPVVLICGVLPLGAAVAIFNTIKGVMEVSSLKGAELEAASVVLTADMGKAFTVSLAIAFGLGVGLAIVDLIKRRGTRGIA